MVPRTLPTTLLLVTMVGTIPLIAQVPIDDARVQALGSSVTVRGIVTNGAELGGIRYLQDGTGALAVFPGTGSIGGFSPQRGADVSVTGVLKLFNGLLELDPVTAFTIHSTNNVLPPAQVIAPSGMDEGTESELVKLVGCTFPDPSAPFSAGNRTFNTGGQTAAIYLRTGHPLIGSAVPTGVVDIVGIVSQFSTATPPSGGYQLLPRNAADLVPSVSIAIVGGIRQTSIEATGFTLEWTTNVAGSAHVRYGPDASMGSLVSAGTVGTQHSVPLSGLPPATAFHAQAYSVNDDDTAWSSIQLYSTASPDPGNITVYFNKPVDISVATGPYAIDLGTAIDDTIKAYMDRALSTIDVAVYNTTSNLMVDAANDAHSRGVRVRWIAEASNSNTALQGLLPAIPVLYRTNSTGSGMHNKFVVVDADGGPDACVLTGSANFTNAGFFNDPNNLVVVRDMALARTYRSEFNEMWGGSGPQPEPANSRFGAAKADNTPHLFNVNGTLVQSWFSPSDGTTARIEAALRTADEHIEFALFALTSSDLTEALIDMAALPNVLVRGMVEEEDMNTTTYDALLNGGVDVRPDGAPSSLHHKYAIVDRASATLDPQVITGSHNWSFNAESTNDENTLIIHSALVADQFHQEWNARWTTAVSLPEQATSTNGPVVWPNPTTGVLHVALRDTGSNTIAQVVDMAGRTVHSSAMPKGHDTLSLEHLAPGSYVLRVGQDGRHAHVRFVIGR